VMGSELDVDGLGCACDTCLPFGFGTCGSGGNFGRAYSSVHCRAVESCVLRLRVYWDAIEGTAAEWANE
jgi:hypothetical protein